MFDRDVTFNSDHLVEWRIDKNPPWWQGTTIRFELSGSENGRTQMLFTMGDSVPKIRSSRRLTLPGSDFSTTWWRWPSRADRIQQWSTDRQ